MDHESHHQIIPFPDFFPLVTCSGNLQNETWKECDIQDDIKDHAFLRVRPFHLQFGAQAPFPSFSPPPKDYGLILPTRTLHYRDPGKCSSFYQGGWILPPPPGTSSAITMPYASMAVSFWPSCVLCREAPFDRLR